MQSHLRHMVPTRLPTLLCFVSLGWIASGCGADVPVAYCTAPASLSVVIAVRDSTTGQPAADGALGTLVGAGVNDTLFQSDSLTLSGGNQIGTYTVTIDRPGYLTWIMSNVRVTERGPCGNVIPVELSARLQPATR
ncbi:MAG: hypothetical protein JWO39_2004 [Gemmatimonadetes bacterium]|nr:hypothetical protein [Gemmatimonadota bacterium]